MPLDDAKSYELLARADTVGVFQLEGTGMRDSLKRLRPDRFEDIIAMVALYRPGPMDNIPTYINRKHGEEPVDCLHPMLEPILKETYGVIIYQEQVMQIAQVMAGFSLGEADLLRRAMGKKDKREMAQQKTRFVEGAIKNGVKKADAEYIFELVDKFAGYGFNKSHAAAYALVSYHTAYLKANYREEFLAASMTLDMGNTDKLAMYTAEARKSGIAIEPPCINASEVDFLAGDKTIRYSLAALKNIGAQAVAEPGRRARRPTAPSRTCPTSPADATRRLSTSGRSRPWLRCRRLRRAGAEPRARARQCRADAGICRAASPTTQRRAPSDLFGGGESAPAQWTSARSRPGRRWSGCSTSSRRLASSSRVIRSTPTRQCSPSSTRSRLPSSRPARSAVPWRAGSLASWCRRASADRRRATSSPSPCSRSPRDSSKP